MRGKKKTSTLDKWKTIRVRRKTLALLHDAIRANPVPESFEPYFDVETVSDSHVFDSRASSRYGRSPASSSKS